MNISARLAHDTLALIAQINRTSPTDGQVAEPATLMESVETLTALNYDRWMQRLMEEDWRETEGKLQELFANWMGRYRRRELRHLAKDWIREPEDRATDRLLELWVTENELKRLVQLVTEREFPDARIPVSFVIVGTRTTVRSVLNFVRNDRKLTQEEIAEGLREMRENKDEDDYFASLGMINEPQE